MQPHEQRVVTERDELIKKTRALSDFMGGAIYANLEYEDRKLLSIQIHAMTTYTEVLNARIGRFNYEI